MSRQTIAIDFGRRRLRAVLAGRSGAGLSVRKVVTEPVPHDVVRDDAAAMGAWAAGALVRAGIPRGSATVAIPREHVAMKRLNLPTGDERELPAMTRLAVRRDLPFDAEDAVIDYMVLERGENSTAVLAVAVARPVLEFARSLARHAGLEIERVSLRAMGAAALVGSLGPGNALGNGAASEAGGVLAVDIMAERVEFSVIVGGRVRFSRAGDLPAVDDPAELAEAVITETRRTWMSYRIAEESNDVRRAVVIGEADIAPRVAGAIADVLKVPTEVLAGHPLVELSGAAGAPGAGMDGAWPLAGLLLEPGLGITTIDLARPKQAPDVASRRRQIVLGAAGAVMVLAAAGATWARFNLQALQRTESNLKAERSGLIPKYDRYKRDAFRLEHLQKWESAGSDWLAHLGRVVDLAPPPPRVVLDSWIATLDFDGVKWDRRTKTMSAPAEVRLVVEGEAADRSTADAYRGALVESDAYSISTTGPDAQGGKRLPFGFSYHLRAAPPADGSKPSEPQRTARRDDP